MKVIKSFLRITFLFFVFIPYAFTQEEIVNYDESVSLIKLIASPEKYEGKKIRTIGVFGTCLMECVSTIFLTKQDVDVWNQLNGIAIIFEDSYEAKKDEKIQSLHKKYVQVQGVFFPNKEPGYLYQGIIKNIDFIYSIEEPLEEE